MQLDCCCIQLKSGAVIRLLPTELLSLLTTQMVRDWRQSKFSSFSDWYKLLCCMPMPPIQGTLSSLKWRKTEHFCFERLLGIKRQFRQTSPARSTDIWKIQLTLLLIISLLDRLLIPEVTNWPNHTLNKIFQHKYMHITFFSGTDCLWFCGCTVYVGDKYTIVSVKSYVQSQASEDWAGLLGNAIRFFMTSLHTWLPTRN